MDEFNLIPESFRRRRRLKRWLLGFSVFYLCAVAAIGTGRVALTDVIEEAQLEIADL